MTVYIDAPPNDDWIKRTRRLAGLVSSVVVDRAWQELGDLPEAYEKDDDEELAAIEFGDLPGHAFRGNQYTGGTGEEERDPRLADLKDESKAPGLQLKAIHFTTDEAARAIQKNGWDVYHGGGFGHAFGSGVYGFLDTDSGRKGENEDFVGGGRQLDLEVTTANPLVVDVSQLNSQTDDGGWETSEQILMRVADVDGTGFNQAVRDVDEEGRANYQQYVDAQVSDPMQGRDWRYQEWHAENTPNQPIESEHGGISLQAQAIREVLVDRGYDSIVYRDPHYRDSSLWGDQIVALDPTKVKIIDAGTEAKTVSINEYWKGADKPGLTSAIDGRHQRLIGLVELLELMRRTV